METTAQFSNKNQQEWNVLAWRDVVEEVMKRKANGQNAGIFSESKKENEAAFIEASKKQMLLEKGTGPRYSLGAKYKHTYFTKREAECMVWLLKNKTIADVAMMLGLSKRTVEFYINHMKAKIGCRTKRDLISSVQASDFKLWYDYVHRET